MMTPNELKAWRKAHGLSQEALAKEMGIATKTLQRYEWGYFPIPLRAEKMLALLSRV